MRMLWIASLVACGGSSKPAPTSPGSGSAPEPPVAEVTQSKVSDPEVEAPAKPIDDKVARDASMQFLTILRDSKGAIGRCHETAVTKNASLKDRTVSLVVAADFDAAGGLAKLTLSPFLSDEFETCVKTIAAGWKMTPPQKMSFKASINLTP